MRNKIIGGAVGGCLGFIIGAMLADHLYPEFYGEGWEEADIGEYPVDYGPSAGQEVKTQNLVGKPMKGEKPGRVVDYAKYGGFQKKPPLEDFVKEDEVIIAVEFDEDDPSLYGDYTDLSQVSYEEYLAVRDETEPFFLSALEFEDMEADEPNMPVTVLTYYADDDVLVRAIDNRPIDVDPVKLVGDKALYPRNSGIFGNSKNIVYIYNPILEGVYQIITIHKSFEEAVAGTVRQPKRPKPQKEEDE